MIKVSTGTIPDITELKDAINKKWNINSAPDNASIPRMYVQDVGNNVPTTTISQPEQNVKQEVAPLPTAVTQVQELPVVNNESVSNERALIKTDERIASEQRLKSELEDEALIGDGYTSIFTKLKTQLENTGGMVKGTTAFGDIYYIQKKSSSCSRRKRPLVCKRWLGL